MLSEDTKLSEFHQYQISDKTPSIIYADLESLIKRINGCKYNFEKSSTATLGKHFPCEYSMPTNWTFHCIENKHDEYRGDDYMKKFC